jgi:hypothetical protein
LLRRSGAQNEILMVKKIKKRVVSIIEKSGRGISGKAEKPIDLENL